MKRLLKSLISSTSFRRFVFPRWRYNFAAIDLLFMCNCLEELRGVNGSVVEVGCEYGETTLFLNRFMSDSKLEKKYYCIDTFDGFTENDIRFEIETRAKRRENLLGFRKNSKKWFKRTVSDAGYNSIGIFQADASVFDFSLVSPISFALIDIDLFKPIQACLPKIFDALSPGGMILVDDCDPSDANYDGAYYAYVEFMGSRNLPIKIFGKKLGIIKKRY